jgi:segregation and condensation protein A
MHGIAADPVTGPGGEADGLTPLLALDGFNGPLERLLTLARTQQIDLARLPLVDLVDQLAAALRLAPEATSLGQKGDWVVMASWLLQLRSLLLLPAETQAHQGEDTTDHPRGHAEAQALATWLDRRPLLGRDVFARGQPQPDGTPAGTEHVDVIEFLWACLALFDDAADSADTAAHDRPRWLDLYVMPEARDRILRLLAEAPDGGPLGRFLPQTAAEANALRRRSAWTTTFAASLELAKQGELVLAQDGLFLPIRVWRAMGRKEGQGSALDPPGGSGPLAGPGQSPGLPSHHPAHGITGGA